MARPMGWRSLALVVVVAATVLAGCGQGLGSDSREASRIAQLLRDKDVPGKAADCLGEELAKDGVTADQLRPYMDSPKLPTGSLSDSVDRAFAVCDPQSSEDSRVNACKVEKSTFETAIEAYNAQADQYPTSIEQLTHDTAGPSGATIKAVLKRVPTYWELAPAHDGTVVAKGPLPADCS